MQIIWISGATSHYRKFNVTKTQLTRFAVVLGLILIMIGSAIHFLGLRVAIKFDPDMVRDMGGVITAQELYHLEEEYRERLARLQDSLKSMDQKVETLSKINDQYAALATPLPLKEKRKDKGNEDSTGRGGPYLPFFSPKMDSEENAHLRAVLKKTLDSTANLNKKMQVLEKVWLEKYST
jgi:hypothetical protein